MALRIDYRREVALTTGSTVTINSDYLPPTDFWDDDFGDSLFNIRVTGAQVLVANFLIATSGTIAEGTSVNVLWEATPTLGAFSVSIFGLTMPAAYVTKKFNATFRYSSGAWHISEFCPLVGESESVDGDALKLATVAEKHLVNKAVSYAKFQDLGAYSFPARDAGTSGVMSAVAIAAQSLIVRLAAGFVSLTPSVDGQTIIRRAGALVAAALNFTELAGTIANAQVPDDELALIKQQSTGVLASSYADVATTAVTTEETLFTYTLPANTVAASGKGIRITAAGSVAANNHVKTIRLKINGGLIIYNIVSANPNGLKWSIDVTAIRSGATTSVVTGKMTVGAVNEDIILITPAITWTNDNAITVTGENGTAQALDIVSSLTVVELLK